MRIEVNIPDGFHIRQLESSVTSKGAIHWNVWISRIGDLRFMGHSGFDLQACIDAAHVDLLERERDIAPEPALKLNIQLEL